MTGRDKFHKIRHIISIGRGFFKLLPKGIRKGLFALSRNIPGGIGILIRYVLLSTIAKIGKNVTVLEGVYLKNPEHFTCGDNVSIHSMCYIDAIGKITIGNDVSLAHATTILSETHSYSDKEIPIKYQPLQTKHTVIGNNVWIGAKCTILFGVHIADGSVIGANSVVTKSTLENSINVGSPCKFLKYRF